ncbi:MAG: hypothetical protein ABI686_05480 [Acidobacteriota bacterium]
MNSKSKFRGIAYFLRQMFLCAAIGLIAAGCGAPHNDGATAIEFTKIPPASDGGPKKVLPIEGRVSGASSEQKIVLFARSGTWWVQPQSDKTMTNIESDGTWKNETHLGTEYAALLVEADYRPPLTADELPTVGGSIKVVASVPGGQLGAAEEDAPKFLQFSGYEWKIRTIASDRSGAVSEFDAANAWTDEKGFLHLKISRNGDNWTCAEVSLTRSLGYGTYRLITHDVSQLEPAAVLSFDTWDDLEAGQNHRQVDVEVTRWGDPLNKNLQYVVQPYNIPANVARFTIPGGVLTHSFDWQPGRVDFKTVRGANEDQKAAPIAEHQFSSGVPAPGDERILINFYAFHYAKIPLEKEAEVVIEKFEFLP